APKSALDVRVGGAGSGADLHLDRRSAGSRHLRAFERSAHCGADRSSAVPDERHPDIAARCGEDPGSSTVHHLLHHADRALSLLPDPPAQAHRRDALHWVTGMPSSPRPIAVLGLLLATSAQALMSKEQLLQLLKTLDDRQQNNGDYRALVYLEQKERDQTDVIREAVVYRRSADQRLMILFGKPKSEQGKGYLRVDKNLWSYDPNVGKWERRTERERIAGTDSRRADFDESRMAEEYDPSDD